MISELNMEYQKESITEEQYLEAIEILEKKEQAETVVAMYERQKEDYEGSLIQLIVETGKPIFVDGEVVRGNPMLWRATKIRYEHSDRIVERSIEYSSDSNAKDLLGIKSDKSVVI